MLPDVPSLEPPAARRSGWLQRYGLVLALGLVCVGLAVVKPTFFSAANLLTILRQISINGLLAVGVTVVLLTGGVDLSLGSVVALSGVIAASLAQPEDGPVGLAVVAGVGVGLACGLINGGVVARGGVAPFIATLGMMTAARGLALVWSGGRPVSNLVPQFTALGGDLAGMPVPTLCLAAAAAGVWLLLQRTRWGRHLYAVGSSEAAARAAGVHVERIKLLAYGLCGALAGLAGGLLSSVFYIQPGAGFNPMIKALVVTIFGGLGSIKGTIWAAYVIGLFEAFVQVYFGSGWALPLLFLFMILVLVIRPTGLFGQGEMQRL